MSSHTPNQPLILPTGPPPTEEHARLVPHVKAHFRETLLKSVAAYFVTADQASDDYETLARVAWALMPAAVRETLTQLVAQGPVWDGDILSKPSRECLLSLGFASEACVKGSRGYTVANYRGFDLWKAHSTTQ